MSRSVAPAPAQELEKPAYQLPAETGLTDDGATGLEGSSSTEFQTPGLRIIQSNSPQLVRNSTDYNPDAKAGDILNTATGERWDGEVGLDVVVVAKDYHYGEWIPRNPDGSGGGFRGMHLPDDPVVVSALRQHGRFKKLPWTNNAGEHVELVETGQLYVLYGEPPMTAETAQLAYISLTSTMMPVYTRWMSRHAGWKYRQANGMMKEAKLWAYRWRLTTVPQSRGAMHWFIFRLDLVNSKPLESLTAVHDRSLFLMAGDWYEQFAAGMLKAAQQQPDEEPVNDGAAASDSRQAPGRPAPGGASRQPPGRQAGEDDEIPF